MIKYKANGLTITRMDWGERTRLILESLSARPWQTRRELSVDDMQLRRMMKRGLIQRRTSARKNKPYEYAVASELQHAAEQQKGDGGDGGQAKNGQHHGEANGTKPSKRR